MDVLENTKDWITVRLNSDETAILTGALNESLELEDWEFETRMGATKERVRELLDAFVREARRLP